jgi:peptide/nickel transport system ATP-binding protein
MKKLLAAVPIPDPARRTEKRGMSNDEIKNAVRAADYQPPLRQYSEIPAGHVVQVWGEEWPI